MPEGETTVVTIEVPDDLLRQAQVLVEAGLFQSLDGLIGEALRRHLAGHSAEAMDSFIREDAEWGLHGKE